MKIAILSKTDPLKSYIIRKEEIKQDNDIILYLSDVHTIHVDGNVDGDKITTEYDVDNDELIITFKETEDNEGGRVIIRNSHAAQVNSINDNIVTGFVVTFNNNSYMVSPSDSHSDGVNLISHEDARFYLQYSKAVESFYINTMLISHHSYNENINIPTLAKVAADGTISSLVVLERKAGDNTDTFVTIREEETVARASASNFAPIIGAGSLVMNEDSTILINATTLAEFISDPEGDRLTITSLSIADGNGGIVAGSTNNFTFSPSENFHGQQTLNYIVTDGNGARATGSLTVNILPVDDAPTAGNVNISLDEDTTTVVNISDILSQSYDVDGDSLNLVSVNTGDTMLGNFSYDPIEDKYIYIPNDNLNGFDAKLSDNTTPIEFTITDGVTNTTANLTFTIDAINDVPTLENNNILGGGVNDGDTLTLTKASIVARTGYSDIDGDSLDTITISVNGAKGSASIDGSGNILYTPTPEVPTFKGLDSITLSLHDGNAASVDAVINFGLNNNIPTANDFSKNINEDSGLYISNSVLLNSSHANPLDPDGDSLTMSVATEPDNGTAIVDSSGNFSYIPNENFTGVDAVVLQFADGYGGIATSTITIMVDPAQEVTTATLVTGTDDGDTIDRSGLNGDNYILVEGPKLTNDSLGNMTLWLDAQDPLGNGSSYTFGANNLSTWFDKSGSNNHFTGSLVNYVDSLYNQRHGLFFDGSDLMSGDQVISAGDRSFSMAFVSSRNVTGSLDTILFQQTSSLGNLTFSNVGSRPVGRFGDNNAHDTFIDLPGGGRVILDHYNLHPSVTIITVDDTNFQLINSTNGATFTSNNFTLSGLVSIGSDGISTINRYNNIAEVIVFDLALDSSEVELLENYLANKYLLGYGDLAAQVDTLTGNAGSDVFSWSDNSIATADIITNFTPSEGDKIELNFDTKIIVDDTFSVFSGLSNELIWYDNGVNSFVEVSWNRDNIANFKLELTGVSDAYSIKLDDFQFNRAELLNTSGTLNGTAGDNILIGWHGDDVLVGNDGADILTGNNGNDIIIGGVGADVISAGSHDDIIVYSNDDASVDAGTGNDYLVFYGENESLNLISTTINFQGIELIDLRGTGNNSFTTDEDSLISLSEETNTHFIRADDGDVINISGWTQGGLLVEDGITYNAYTSGIATLYIEDNDVTVNT